VIFVSGDDGGAKAEVIAVFEDAGFAAIELGNLATGNAKSAEVVAPSHAM
jgi:predicted dinucleotide-binding enzyme